MPRFFGSKMGPKQTTKHGIVTSIFLNFDRDIIRVKPENSCLHFGLLIVFTYDFI